MGERAVVTWMLLLLLVLWLGFSVHASPRFPGSLLGGIVAIAALVSLVLVPLGYALVKRTRRLKHAITPRVSMRTLLAWHVHAGVAGAILALLHTAHKFDSALGIALTTSMLLAVATGYIGRHFQSFVVMELREKEAWLARLRAAYNAVAIELATKADPLVGLARSHRAGRWLATLMVSDAAITVPGASAGVRAIRLAESIADVEYAIASHELLKIRSSRWLKLHALTWSVFYLLLVLHVWASVHFGLRWWS
jgi:hypothetical protein